MNAPSSEKCAPILYMGPIRGGTDHIYRNAFARHFSGFDLAVAPFINCINANKITRKYVHGLLPENNTGIKVIPQILSKSAEGFLHLANYLTDLGYDTINWNLGCPFPQVANKHRGSGLLPFPDKIREFLDAVVPSMQGRLSIKTRLGREHSNEILALLPIRWKKSSSIRARDARCTKGRRIWQRLGPAWHYPDPRWCITGISGQMMILSDYPDNFQR
jgi:tRNA-dihydrouridine synthase